MAPFFQPLLSLIVLTALWTTGVHSAPQPCGQLDLSRRQDTSNTSTTTTSLTESVASSTTTTSASPIPTSFVPCEKPSPPVPANTTCNAFVNEQGISLDVFLSINTDLDVNCSNLQSNRIYCLSKASSLPTHSVAKPPTAPNDTISDCAQYYTAADGDTCETILAEAIPAVNTTFLGIRLMNPSVGNDCTGLMAGLSYCVQPQYNSSVVDSTVSNTTSAA